MRSFLLIVLVCWVLGIALGVMGIDWQAVEMVGLAGFLLVWRLLGRSNYFSLIAWGMILLGFVWGGASWVGMADGCGNIDFPWQGEVVDQPDIRESSKRFVAKDERGCRLLVTVGRWEEVGQYDEILIEGGEVQYLEEVRDYSEGYAVYLERQGISGTLRWPDFERRGKGKLLVFTKFHHAVRERIIKVFSEPEASIVQALLLAERGTLPDKLSDQLRASGVSHIIAISGLHISLLTGLLIGLMLFLPLNPWMRTVAALSLLWIYVVFIGMPTSAVRVATFWTLALMAMRLRMLVSLPTVIILAVSVLATLSPLLLVDVGFQLSVSSVTGIFLALFMVRGGEVKKKRYAWLINGVLVSLGATLATAPLIAYHFGNISLLGLVTNVLVVPLVPLLLIVAILAMLASLLSMPLSLILAYVFHLLLAWVLLVSGLVARVPYGFLEEISFPVWGVGVYYLFLALLLVWLLRKQKRSWREVWG